MRKFKSLIIAAAITLLSGCIPHTELDKQAIVQAMGIDYSDEKYEVTVQYFNMEGAGGSSPIDPSKANIITVGGKGDTVGTALESASVKCGRNFMYGITSIIVLGKDTLNQDILKTLSFAESYYQSNPAVLIAAAEDKAKDIMDVKFKEGVVSVERLEAGLKNAEYHGLGETTKILELLSAQRRKSAGTPLPLLKTVNGSDASDDGKTVELTGGVLLVDRRYAGNLTLSQLSGIQLVGEKPQNTVVSAIIDEERVNVTVYDVTTDLDWEYEEGKLKFEIDLHANGKYTDSQLRDKDASFSSYVEDACEMEIKRRISDAINGTTIPYGCDPFRLKYVISSDDFSSWRKIEGNFSELLKNAEFEINCDVDIDRFGIAH